MNKYTMIVLRKELKDIFRDRRSIMLGLLLPLVLYPLIFTLMGKSMSGMESNANENTTVAIENVPGISDILTQHTGITVTDVDDVTVAIKEEQAKVGIRGTVSGDGKFNVEVIYDEQKSDSLYSSQRIVQILAEYNSVAVAQELNKLGIDLTTFEQINYTEVTLQKATNEPANEGNMMLSMVIPMIMCIFLAVGSMATANDLFAGEKERKTMEPLLCTRSGRGSILTGKFIACTIMGLLSVFSSIVGMVVGFVLNPSAMSMGETTDSLSFTFNPAMIVLIVALLLVMAMIFSGIHVAISTYSKTTKEAATFGSFVMLGSYVPVFMTMMMQAGDFKLWSAFVPVLNIIGSTKILLAGMENIMYILFSILSSIVVLAVILGLTRWLFKKETIMLR